MPIIEDTVRTNLQLFGMSKYSTDWMRVGRGVNLVNRELGEVERRTLGIGVALGSVGAILSGGMRIIMREAGQLQMAQMGLETILGSAKEAGDMVKRLQEFAVKTPFDFPQTLQAARKLRAAGIEGEYLFESMTAVGDAIAAVGGDTEKFSLALDTLFRIQTRGRIFARDLFSLGAHGIPIARILKNELGLSTKELARIGELNIPAEKAVRAIVTGLQKEFGGGMARMSETLVLSLSNLRDAIFQVGAAMGAPLLGLVAGAARSLTSFLVVIKDSPNLAGLMGAGLATLTGVMIFFGLKTGWAAAQTIMLAGALVKAEAASRGLGGSLAVRGGTTGGVAGAAAGSAAAGGGMLGWLFGGDPRAEASRRREAGIRGIPYRSQQEVAREAAKAARIKVAGTTAELKAARIAERVAATAFRQAEAAEVAAAGVVTAAQANLNTPGNRRFKKAELKKAKGILEAAKASTAEAATAATRSIIPVYDLEDRQRAERQALRQARRQGSWTQQRMFGGRVPAGYAMGGIGAMGLGASAYMMGPQGQDKGSQLYRILMGGVTGAGMGAMTGNPIGVAIGAVGGVVAATIGEHFRAQQGAEKEAEKKPEDAALANARDQLQIQQQQLAELQAIRTGGIQILSGGKPAKDAAAPGHLLVALSRSI